jgi:hypothetical protein
MKPHLMVKAAKRHKKRKMNAFFAPFCGSSRCMADSGGVSIAKVAGMAL